MILFQMLPNIASTLSLNPSKAPAEVGQLNVYRLVNAFIYGAVGIAIASAANGSFAQSQLSKPGLTKIQSQSKPSQGNAGYIYRAKTGDTPESIAFEFLAEASQKNVREKFYLLNRVSPSSVSKQTTINQPFNIPIDWMYLKPVLATVVSMSGSVQVSRANAVHEFTSLTGSEQLLDEGSTIQTGSNSFVVVRLPDSSILSITPRSEVSLEMLRRYASSDIFKIKMLLNKGRVESDVKPLTHQASDYSVRSRRLTTGVRGTQFNVSDNLGSNATAEVLEGAVKLTDKSDKSQSVPKGFGSFIAQDKAADVVALLPAPVWQCKVNELLLSDVLPLTFSQKPNSYRVDIFSPKSGTQLTALNSLTLPDNLPDGKYRFGVRGGDINGIQGYSSEQLISVREVIVPGSKQWVFNENTQTWAIEESRAKATKQYKCDAS